MGVSQNDLRFEFGFYRVGGDEMCSVNLIHGCHLTITEDDFMNFALRREKTFEEVVDRLAEDPLIHVMYNYPCSKSCEDKDHAHFIVGVKVGSISMKDTGKEWHALGLPKHPDMGEWERAVIEYGHLLDMKHPQCLIIVKE